MRTERTQHKSWAIKIHNVAVNPYYYLNIVTDQCLLPYCSGTVFPKVLKKGKVIGQPKGLPPYTV